MLSELKALRHGTLAEMIRFLMLLPEEERPRYVIDRPGSSRLSYADARTLAAHPDFPRD